MQSLSFSVSPQEMSMELRTQLSQFGLNPQDWFIQPLTHGIFSAIHRHDADLVLCGHVHLLNGRARWSSLELLEDEISA